MKLARLLLVALLALIVMNSGCVGFIRDTYQNVTSPVPPAPSAPVSVTPIPINQTIERQYNFVDRFNAGLQSYNDGIITWNQSRNEYGSADWANATADIGRARAYMEQARTEFTAMKAYAATPDESNLSDRWNETAYYQVQAFDFVNQSYQEGQYQASRSFAEQNPIKYNYYVSQANYYISLAKASKDEAEQLENKTFMGQVGQVK